MSKKKDELSINELFYVSMYLFWYKKNKSLAQLYYEKYQKRGGRRGGFEIKLASQKEILKSREIYEKVVNKL